MTDNAVQWIAQIGFDPQYGARPVKRIIQKEILNKISKEIIANSINKEKKIIIDKNGEGLGFSK